MWRHQTSNIAQDTSSDNLFDIDGKSQLCSTNHRSEDRYVNNYGKSLLNMCTILGLSILNGQCKGDLEGRYTFMSNAGCSVDDYFIFSNDLLSLVFESCELKVEEKIDSDHLPVTAEVVFPRENIFLVNVDRTEEVLQKFFWNEENANMFRDALLSEEAQAKLDTAMNIVDNDVNAALDIFNDCIKDCAECMTKEVHIDRKRKSEDWFDRECIMCRRHVRKLLRVCRRTSKIEDQQAFVVARREYKNLINRKRKQHNNTLLNNLVRSVGNQKEFWNSIRKVSFKRTQPQNNIRIDMWFEHFKSLLETEINGNDNTDSLLNEEEDDSMNRPISKEEVLLALKNLRMEKQLVLMVS